MKNRIRLLSLASVVPFPGQRYLVGCRSSGVSEGGSATVALLLRGADVGCFATATAVSEDLVSCKAHAQRFRLPSSSSASTPGWLNSVDSFLEDLEGEVAAEQQLQAEVWQLVSQLREVHAANELAAAHLDPGQTPSAFSFALASASELDLSGAQALLECASTRDRLTTLKKSLQRAVAFAATQKALQALAGFGR